MNDPYRSHSFDELWELPTVYSPDLLADRTVLITGGAGGIGTATTVLCARLGAAVVICGRNPEPIDALAADLTGRGVAVLARPTNVRDPDDVAALVDAAWERFGRLDVVVNNAGGQFSAPALDISPKGWHAVVETNLYGSWYVMQAAARRWSDAGEPDLDEDRCVVNISTIVGRGGAGIAHTAAARGGQINLTRYLAVEWAPLQIRTNAIAVGVIASEGLRHYPDSARASFGNNPMRRLGDVWDIAQGVVYLSSPAASFITGTTLELTGGEHVWGEYWPLGRPDYFEGPVVPMSDPQRIDSTRLQRMARAYCDSALLWAALDLGLFTHVHGGAADVPAVAAACEISELNAQRLVSCLLALDLLRFDDRRLVNAPDADRFLVKGSDRYAGPWMRFTRPDVAGWMGLTDQLRSPEPPHRLGMYEDLTVEAARTYHQATASIGMGAGRRFARTVDLAGRRHLLDLGGGSGAYSIQAVTAHPELRATVFDLPPVVIVTAEYLARHGVAGRVDTIGGDFTVDPFPACDVVVMASNLPIYDETVIGGVVAKAFDALEPGGEMHLVGEMLNDDGVGPLDAALWGMQEILYQSGGKAHSRAQVRDYFAEAGFVDIVEHEFVPDILVRVTGTKPVG